jgi:hypothetical protein
MEKDALIQQEFARVRGNLVALKRKVEELGPPCTQCAFGRTLLRVGNK